MHNNDKVFCASYLFRCEPWDQLGNILPVYLLRRRPQRAQDHIQDQEIVVIWEVVINRANTIHFCGAQDKKGERNQRKKP